jgi:hypothetical protein
VHLKNLRKYIFQKQHLREIILNQYYHVVLKNLNGKETIVIPTKHRNRFVKNKCDYLPGIKLNAEEEVSSYLIGILSIICISLNLVPRISISVFFWKQS